MENTIIKHQVVLILCCCIMAALTGCAPHSFKTKKHQYRNFLGEKHKQKSTLSLESNTSASSTHYPN